MTENGSAWLSTVVPLIQEVSKPEIRGSLPALVDTGEITLYVRVPAGKAVYMDGLKPLPTSINTARASWPQSLSPNDLAQIRDAKRVNTPVVRYPMIVPDAVYLGLEAKDARRLLDLGSVDVHWFPCAVQFSPQSGPDAKHLIRRVPWRSPYCLKPDDGQPKRGPWIGHDTEHALAIELRDVFVEQGAAIGALRAKEDPFALRETSPGLYVLCRAAMHFNDPEKGVEEPRATFHEWILAEAKACKVAGWLFNKELLKQVRKLINTRHKESQGLKEPTKLDISVLSEHEARDLQKRHWVSARLMLAIHAARYWRQQLDSLVKPSWETTHPNKQLLMTRRFGQTLGDWGFESSGEHDAVLSVAIYPVRVTEIRRKQKAEKVAQEQAEKAAMEKVKKKRHS
jgi:hypothetical protein